MNTTANGVNASVDKTLKVQLNGETRLFPIIGDPIAQVKSPQNLSHILQQRGVNALVIPLHVHPTDLPATMAVLKSTANIGGMAVTIPHKIPALDYCAELSERARFVGSVNIIRKRADGSLVGDNVDGIGYLDGIHKEGFDITGKRALLVGVGGAGAAVAFEILQRDAAFLAIHDLNAERRDSVVQRLAERFPGRVAAGSGNPESFDLVANVTPVGMKAGDPYPVEVEKLLATQFVADAITRPEVSPLVQFAHDLGCKTMTGAGMFNAEAAILVDYLLGDI
ncbi:MAG TPA: hypothetical protein PLB10_08670 [Thiolinea sp.]|nr:hypothetical protein [Thiolinea sp.]